MALAATAQDACETIRSLPADARVRILAGPTADGIAGAAVLVAALRRARRAFHVSHPRGAPEPVAVDETYDATVYLDLPPDDPHPGPSLVLGPASIEAWDVVHVASETPRGASASTAALAVAVAMDAGNWDLAPHALVGAFARGQAEPSVVDWNQAVIEEGLRRGQLEAPIRLALPDRTLADVLERPAAPWRFLRGGEGAATLLADFGLPAGATSLELDEHEAESLASLAVLRSLASGVPAHEVKSLFRPAPVSCVHERTPVARLASLSSAAAWEREEALALGFLLGDASARAALEAIEVRARGKVHQAAVRLAMGPNDDRSRVRVIALNDPDYVGAIVADLVRSAPPPTVLIGHAPWGTTRRVAIVSSSLPEDAIEAVGSAARRCGGRPGPSGDALEAFVPADALQEFVERVEERFGAQRGGSL